jgi:deoxyribose-phosphate aldolase
MKIQEYIDHTLLKPDATEAKVVKLCREAAEYGFASVCVNPFYIPLVSRELEGSGVKPCAVVGFPLGATTKKTKAFEAAEAVANGAGEVDMVINIGALKDGKSDVVKDDIEEVVKAVQGKAAVKVILECCLLTADEIQKACELAVQAGADFVKTSTGFSTGGARVEDVTLMRKTVGDKAGVKASGGIKDYQTAKEMIDAGATRLGASAGVEIVKAAPAG